MNQAQLRKAIRDLIRSPKTTTSDPHPFTNTKDLYPTLQQYFSPEAQQILSVRANGMVHQYNEPGPHAYLYNLIELAALLGIKSAQSNPCTFTRNYSLVQCFGFRCRPDQVAQAADRLVVAVNHMASNKWINASLYNLGMMELGKHNPQDPDMVVVFSYLAVPANKEATVKAALGSIMFAEGGMPPEFR